VSLGPNYRKLFTASTISNLGDGVGQIAYPWLASAVTRNPVLIALVAVAQRLPWLVFSLPAGVITDRHDRRLLMVGANAARAVLTLFVASAVLWRADRLPGPDELEQVVGTEAVLYLCVLAATLLLGVGEVLYDNTAQTFMPRLVDQAELERANGRMFSGELVANQFAGPPLGSLLLIVGFAVPFFLDAATFAVSAALIFAITPTLVRAGAPAERKPWREEIGEGFRWLWRHDLLRTLAIVLGALNGLNNLTGAVLVLYAQEVLGTSTTEFAVLSMSLAVGGVLGGWMAARIIAGLGPGALLQLSLVGGAITSLVVGLMSSWPIPALMFAIWSVLVVLWNIITVSFRQAVIPDRLLGRVNSVYRFFGWGMIPIGSLIGGAIVVGVDAVASREAALRAPWMIAAAAQLLLLIYALPRLTTAKMNAARAAATSATGEAAEPAPVDAPAADH
jgi:MFS family permease